VAASKKHAPRAIERERKFLVKKLPPALSRYPHELIEQGYLAIADRDDESTEVRLRRIGKRYVLTVKRGRGESRLEREVPVSPRSARILWPLTRGRRIKKVRYRIPYGGVKIELDVYRDKASGLAVAEVEFGSERALRRFDPPSWFGREVTGRKRLSNSELAVTGWKRRADV
jgi:adenylate cyclase